MAEYAAPSGAPIWFDLMSSDTAKAEEFYGAIFGWEAEAPDEEMGGYRNFHKNGKRVAGLSPVMEGAGPPDAAAVLAILKRAPTVRTGAKRAGQHLRVIDQQLVLALQPLQRGPAGPVGGAGGLHPRHRPPDRRAGRRVRAQHPQGGQHVLEFRGVLVLHRLSPVRTIRSSCAS